MKSRWQVKRKAGRFGIGSGVRALSLAALLGGIASTPLRADDPERFMASIEKQGVAMASMSEVERLYQSCIYCHGKAGNAGSSYYPRLAAQPRAYLQQQLHAYRDETRPNTIMSSLARMLSLEEIDQLADYLATQPLVIDNPVRPKATAAVAQGKAKAAARACASCHGANYQGQGAYPRLAGQGHEYLAKQLKSFRDGQRRDPQGVMAGFAAGLSDADVEQISRYLSEI